jgi:hypothetical protein
MLSIKLYINYASGPILGLSTSSKSVESKNHKILCEKKKDLLHKLKTSFVISATLSKNPYKSKLLSKSLPKLGYIKLKVVSYYYIIVWTDFAFA